MKLSQGAILIAIGFLMLYLVITGKVDCFVQAFRCAFQSGGTSSGAVSKTTSTSGGILNIPKFGRSV